MIKLYSKPNCMPCMATKKELDRQGLEYTVVDITKDSEAMDYILGLGYVGVPVVDLGQDNTFYGFRPDKIKDIAKAQELDNAKD